MAIHPTESKLPSFLCVGAQKAGTTTLHSLLGVHPKIFLPSRKEVHFFSLNYSKGLKWYSQQFSLSKNDQEIGEITPYYLFHPYAAERISRDLGDVRIIILLRDPLARTLSHYSHACRHGFEELILEQALKSENSRLAGSDSILKNSNGRHQQHQECSYLSRSLYRNQVERYWNYFGKNNVLILPSELMFDSPWDCLKKIFDFIGLMPCAEPEEKILNVRKNKGNISLLKDINPALVSRIRRNLEDSYRFAIDEIGWDASVNWHWKP